MKPIQIVYLPIGVPTFHQETARATYEASLGMLLDQAAHLNASAHASGDDTEKGLVQICAPDDMLRSSQSVREFLDDLSPELVIVQNTTFANGAYVSEVLHTCGAPVLLWAVREPAGDGGRLKLNSLTGSFSAANSIRSYGRSDYGFVFGAAEEEDTRKKILAWMQAAKLKVLTRQLKLAQIGHTPEGFGFGRGLDLELLRSFGVTLLSVEARELINRAKVILEEREETEKVLRESCRNMPGMDALPMENQLAFAALLLSYQEFCRKMGVEALSSRCWPDYFTDYGTPVCAVLAVLNDSGIAAACETDTFGALSMYIGMQLSHTPVFFGDPVALDEEENTMTYWHCGTAACSLARKEEGAQIGVHCNRRIGPTMNFGCKGGTRATVFRIGRNPDGSVRLYAAGGETLDRPRQYTGTSQVVRMDTPVRDLVERSVLAGWEPHFVVIYGDYLEELKALAAMYGMEITIESSCRS